MWSLTAHPMLASIVHFACDPARRPYGGHKSCSSTFCTRLGCRAPSSSDRRKFIAASFPLICRQRQSPCWSFPAYSTFTPKFNLVVIPLIVHCGPIIVLFAVNVVCPFCVYSCLSVLELHSSIWPYSGLFVVNTDRPYLSYSRYFFVGADCPIWSYSSLIVVNADSFIWSILFGPCLITVFPQFSHFLTVLTSSSMSILVLFDNCQYSRAWKLSIFVFLPPSRQWLSLLKLDIFVKPSRSIKNALWSLLFNHPGLIWLSNMFLSPLWSTQVVTVQHTKGQTCFFAVSIFCRPSS